MLPLMTKNVVRQEKIIKNFDGINLTDDNSFMKMTASVNMSSANFPSVKSANGLKSKCVINGCINGVFAYNGFIYTSYSDNEDKIFLTYEDTSYEFTSYSASDNFKQKRKMSSLGEKIYIIPDKVIFDTSTKKFESAYLNETTTKETSAQRYTIQSGKSDIVAKDIEKLGRILSDRLTSLSMTYQSGRYEYYYSVFDPSLKVGDVVTIKAEAVSYKAEGGSEYTAFVRAWKEGYTFQIKDITKVNHTTPNGSVTETTCLYFGDNVVNTGGYSDAFFTSITVIRQVPDLTDICSYNNRIWGVGGNYIYASKLGDMSQWNDFSTDAFGVMPNASYKVMGQTEGDFSSIINYGNFIYALKDNSISKIYGETPEEFKVYSQRAKGSSLESKDSAVFLKNSLIYVSGGDVYLFDSNLPKKISDKILSVASARKGVTDGDIYYLLCKKDDKDVIYTYDIEKNIWHMLDFGNVDDLCVYNNELVITRKNEVLSYQNLHKQDDEKTLSWSFKLRFDQKLFSKNVYGNLSIRFSLKENSYFSLQPLYDDKSKGDISMVSFDKKDFDLRCVNLSLKRCNYFELLFEGKGDFTLLSIGLKQFTGSEI